MGLGYGATGYMPRSTSGARKSLDARGLAAYLVGGMERDVYTRGVERDGLKGLSVVRSRVMEREGQEQGRGVTCHPGGKGLGGVEKITPRPNNPRGVSSLGDGDGVSRKNHARKTSPGGWSGTDGTDWQSFSIK